MTYREFLEKLSQLESRGFDSALLNAMCENNLDAELDEAFADGLLENAARFCYEHATAIEWRKRTFKTTGHIIER